MEKIIAFGASNSSASINKQFVSWVTSKLERLDTELIDLNDFEMPIYSMDLEKEDGIPQKAKELKSRLETAKGFVISLAEHNGNYAAVFKNIQDWLSRIDNNIWGNKPILLLATSPGKRGGMSVLKIAESSFPHLGAEVVGTFSLPSYFKNFNQEEGILNAELTKEFEIQLNNFNNEF